MAKKEKSKMMHYIFEDGQVKEEPDLLKWASWFETAHRKIALDKIGDVEVSTVFLGIDHGYGEKEPLLFETMIFGGEHDLYQERFPTAELAQAGHEKAKRLVQKI